MTKDEFIKEYRIQKLINIVVRELGYENLTSNNTYFIMKKIWKNWEQLRDKVGYFELKEVWDTLCALHIHYYEKIMCLY